MQWTSTLYRSSALAFGLALGICTAAVAQKPAQAPRTPHRMANRSSMAAKPKPQSTFRGIAAKLNTTPDALESAYQTARQDNAKLTRGQFVAANMLAHNLGDKNSSITSQAILDGLKGGKSIGQTLQGLGLSATDAKAAERQADLDAKAAQRQATKPAT